MDDVTNLYRHFDADGVLLYVGITRRINKRLAEHLRSSHWLGQVTQITIERFPSRDEAVIAERNAIVNEMPLFNIQHSTKKPDDAPDDVFDVSAYGFKFIDGVEHYGFIQPEGKSEILRDLWPMLINQIKQRGHTFASIARDIGCTGAAVRAMARNSEQQPRWSTGDKLVKLHAKVMRRKDHNA